MKKLINISFLLAVLCLAAPVYADGDMSTGTRTCTQNCSSLYDDSNITPTDSAEENANETTTGEIYSWIYEQISQLLG